MNITKIFLEKNYFKENLTQRQTAKLCNCSRFYIQKLMKKFNLKPRTYSEVREIQSGLSKSFLLKEYIENNRSLSNIASELNVSSATVRNYLIRYNIKRRKQTLVTGHPYNYKGGRPHCIDCDKLIWWDFNRCQSCGQKHRAKTKPESYPERVVSSETRKRIGKASKRDWKERREFRANAIIKGLHKTPNKCEKKLNKKLCNLFKGEYKFVGDGKVIIDGFNPDFVNVNGQKKIIELFGDYWHNLPGYRERDKRRIKAYKKQGYKTLIIWEHELKKEPKLYRKLKEFTKRN